MQIPCGRNYFVKKDGAERLLCRDKSLHLHLVYWSADGRSFGRHLLLYIVQMILDILLLWGYSTF